MNIKGLLCTAQMSRKHSFVSSGKQAKGAKPPLFRGRSNSQSSATEVRVLGKAKAPGDHHNTSSAALPRLVGAERNGAGTGGPSSSSSTPELSKGSRVNGAEQIVADREFCQVSSILVPSFATVYDYTHELNMLGHVLHIAEKKELARLRSEFEAISKVVLKLQDDSKKTATDFAERERLWKAEQSARDDLVASLEKENRDLLAKVKGADAKNQLAMEKVEMLRKELEIMKREKEEITMEAERDAAAVAAASAAAIVAATEETTNFCSAATQTDSDVPDSTKVADDEGRQKQQMAEMEILIAKQYEEMERTVQAEQAVSSGLRGKLLEAEERLKTFSEEVVSLRQVAKEITNLEHNMNKLKKKYEMAQKQVQAARAIPARIRKQLMEEQKRSGEAARKVRDAMASE